MTKQSSQVGLDYRDGKNKPLSIVRPVLLDQQASPLPPKKSSQPKTTTNATKPDLLMASPASKLKGRKAGGTKFSEGLLASKKNGGRPPQHGKNSNNAADNTELHKEP